MKNHLLFLSALFILLLTLPGCEVIGGIFKAGVWSGILLVGGVLALIIFAVSRAFKKE
jgi:hypothetical protein